MQTIEEGLENILRTILDTPDLPFSKRASHQKRVFSNMFSDLEDKLELEEYPGMINQLEAIKMLIDGDKNNWITDPVTIEVLINQINDLINHLLTLT